MQSCWHRTPVTTLFDQLYPWIYQIRTSTHPQIRRTVENFVHSRFASQSAVLCMFTCQRCHCYAISHYGHCLTAKLLFVWKEFSENTNASCTLLKPFCTVYTLLPSSPEYGEKSEWIYLQKDDDEKFNYII